MRNVKSIIFFILFVLPVLPISYGPTLCMNEKFDIEIQNEKIMVDKKEIWVAKIDPTTIDNFLEGALKAKDEKFFTGVGLENRDEISFTPRKITIGQIERMLDLLENKLLELHFYHFDLSEIFSENLSNDVKNNVKNKLPEKLRESGILKLKIDSCKNVGPVLFENLPHNLEVLIITEISTYDFYPEANFKWLENLPETIRIMDLSGIKEKTTENFFKNLPKSLEKLKLGCPIESEHLSKFSNDSKLKSLCLKRASIKNGSLENFRLKSLSKLCVPKNFKDKDTENLKYLPKLETLDIGTHIYSEESPEVTGENFNKLPKTLTLIKFDSIIFSKLKKEFLQKFAKNIAKEIYIKQNFLNIEKNKCDKEEKIEILKEAGINVTHSKSPRTMNQGFCINSKFKSCSNVYNLNDSGDFGSPDSCTNLSGLGSPDGDNTDSPADDCNVNGFGITIKNPEYNEDSPSNSLDSPTNRTGKITSPIHDKDSPKNRLGSPGSDFSGNHTNRTGKIMSPIRDKDSPKNRLGSPDSDFSGSPTNRRSKDINPEHDKEKPNDRVFNPYNNFYE